MRISDWSSDVCSSDLARDVDTETIWSIASRKKKTIAALNFPLTAPAPEGINGAIVPGFVPAKHLRRNTHPRELFERIKTEIPGFDPKELAWDFDKEKQRSEEHTSELQSLMRISYAVFCLKKKKNN